MRKSAIQRSNLMNDIRYLHEHVLPITELIQVYLIKHPSFPPLPNKRVGSQTSTLIRLVEAELN